MSQKLDVLLVGDVVQEDRSLHGSLFDADKPTVAEASSLIGWVEAAGFRVCGCESVQDFVRSPLRWPKSIVFPLWRGGLSRNRTAVVPAVCEELGIAYVGGDALVQSLCQDKSVSKSIARDAGFNVSDEWLIRTREELQFFCPSKKLRLPVVVKPLLTGCSIGISVDSLCKTDGEAQSYAARLFDKGLGPVLCEEFVEGEEVSICVVEDDGIVLAKCAATYRDQNGRCPFSSSLFTFDDKMNPASEWTIGKYELAIPPLDEALGRLLRTLGKVNLLRIDGRIRGHSFILNEITPDIHLGMDSIFLGGFFAAGRSPVSILRDIICAAGSVSRVEGV